MSKRVLSVMPVAVLLLVMGTARADVIVTTADGNGADAFIRGGTYAGNNYGTSGTITVKRPALDTNLEYARKGYFRFDLTSQGLSSGAGATSAVFKFAVNSVNQTGGATFTFNVYGLKDGAAGQNWAETGITWNNAPANNTASASGVNTNATLLGTFSLTGDVAAGTLVTFSPAAMTTFVQNDTDGLLTLILTRNTGHNDANHSFVPKETTTGYAPPTLTLTGIDASTAVPEPAGLGLLGLALLGLRKRRSWTC